jgi:tetrapyrrole methylase family protein/MazG family protein
VLYWKILFKAGTWNFGEVDIMRKDDKESKMKNMHTTEIIIKRLMSKYQQLMIIDHEVLLNKHHPPFTSNQPILVVGIKHVSDLTHMYALLIRIFPESHSIIIMEEAMEKKLVIGDLRGFQLLAKEIMVFIPPYAETSTFSSFEEIVARLRAPGGCPWDREQTHQSLRTHLLEETYEAMEAMDKNDLTDLQEELGDLLLQIVLNAEIAGEEHAFRMADVVRGISEKIIRRHPHVFGNVDIREVSGVLKNWEKLKEVERKGSEAPKGMLDGVPKSLPALAQAQEYQDRAARVGFDWDTVEPVIKKVREEFDEVLTAPDDASRSEELGDLLFAVVNLVRWYKTDAENALRSTNQKFARRFNHIENGANRGGKNLTDMSLEEMDVFWEEAKKDETNRKGNNPS